MRLALIGAVAACSSDFHFKAGVAEPTTDPTFVKLEIDGQGSNTFDGYFDSYQDAEANPPQVAITLTTGVTIIPLLPSHCGGACDELTVDCSSVTEEVDAFRLFELAPVPLLESDEGHCKHGDASTAWAE